jgi:hypothetical protein
MTSCQTCGYRTASGPAEFHPYSFCVLVKAGLDPWATVAGLAEDLGPFCKRDRPPTVAEVQAARR